MTRILAYVAEAFSALMRNKARAILTMIGIFIGVGAVDAVYALSAGAAQAIDTQVSTGDQPALTFYPDSQQSDINIAYLSYRDSQVVADQAGSTVRRVIPDYSAVYNSSRRYEVREGSGNQQVPSLGFSWYGGDSDFHVTSGRALSATDEGQSTPVAVVTPALAEKLYGTDTNALDKDIAIRGSRFRIVGIADTKTGTASNYFFGNYYFVLPYTTYHAFESGRTDALLVWIDAPADEDAAKSSVLSIL